MLVPGLVYQPLRTIQIRVVLMMYSIAARNHAWSAQTFVVNVQSCIDETVSKLGFEGNEEMMRTGGG